MPVAAPEKTETFGQQAPNRIPGYLDNLVSENQARRIVSVCSHYSYRPLEELICLYIGISDEVVTEHLAKNFKKVISAQIDADSPMPDKYLNTSDNIEYICCDSDNMGVLDSSIDVIICDSIYEQVDDRISLMSEIYRILRYDGFCYFGACNKYSIAGNDYYPALLPRLVRAVAGFYNRLSGSKGGFRPRLLSLSSLRKLADNFWLHDYTWLIRHNPKAFHWDDRYRPNGLTANIPGRLFRYIYPFLREWVWILTKRR
jgi:SAM-dependent methyltransferase